MQKAQTARLSRPAILKGVTKIDKPFITSSQKSSSTYPSREISEANPYKLKPLSVNPELVCSELEELEGRQTSIQEGINFLNQSGYPDSAQTLANLAKQFRLLPYNYGATLLTEIQKNVRAEAAGYGEPIYETLEEVNPFADF